MHFDVEIYDIGVFIERLEIKIDVFFELSQQNQSFVALWVAANKL